VQASAPPPALEARGNPMLSAASAALDLSHFSDGVYDGKEKRVRLASRLKISVDLSLVWGPSDLRLHGRGRRRQVMERTCLRVPDARDVVPDAERFTSAAASDACL